LLILNTFTVISYVITVATTNNKALSYISSNSMNMQTSSKTTINPQIKARIESHYIDSVDYYRTNSEYSKLVTEINREYRIRIVRFSNENYLIGAGKLANLIGLNESITLLKKAKTRMEYKFVVKLYRSYKISFLPR